MYIYNLMARLEGSGLLLPLIPPAHGGDLLQIVADLK